MHKDVYIISGTTYGWQSHSADSPLWGNGQPEPKSYYLFSLGVGETLPYRFV